jgi:calreticulin
MLYLSIFAILSVVTSEVYFKETFGSGWEDRWVTAEGSGAVDVSSGTYGTTSGLHTTEDAKFYHVAAPIATPFSNDGKSLVLQYSVKNEQSLSCGGTYLKFLGSSEDLASFNGDTDYNIMFGPDVCGSTKRVHAIFNYKGENYLIEREVRPETDAFTHVYTLIVNSDQTYEIKIDGESKQTGSLIDDWKFLGEKEIQDPDQSKPDDWVDEARIDDPDVTKPEGYDDIPAMIVDAEAEQPEDWDEEDDGEWEAPQIANPAYEGPWRQPQIDNPDYVGLWEHPMIPNPDYVLDESIYSYESFGAVGFDNWQVESGSIIGNIIITDSVEEAEAFLAETFDLDAEKAAKEALDAAAAEAEEEEDEEEEADPFDDDEDAGEEAELHDEL